MKIFTKITFLTLLVFCLSLSASAQSYYWVTADRTADGNYMNIRVVKTLDETQPTAIDLGKQTSVASGPYSSSMDASTNCEKAVKAARANGALIKNYCSSTVIGK